MTIFVLLSLAIVVGASWLAWDRRRPPSEPSGPSDHQRRAPKRESYSYEEALPRITSICDVLHRDSRAKAVLVIDNHGRAIGQTGDTQPLTARNVASWAAPLLGEPGQAPTGQFVEAGNAAADIYIGWPPGTEPRSAGNVASQTPRSDEPMQKFVGRVDQVENDNVYTSIIGQRLLLAVLFDDHSSVALVRLRVRKARAELTTVLDGMITSTANGERLPPVFSEITAADLENLSRR